MPNREKPDQLPPDLAEFVRQQHEEAKFRARLWSSLKRWITAGFAVFLGATSGWEAITKVVAWIKGPNP